MELFICEREGRFGPPLREMCRARGLNVTVRETRHPDFVAERLTHDRPAAVLLQVDAERLLAAAQFLARQRTDWPRVRCMVVLEPEVYFARQTLLELGAVLAIVSLRQLENIIDLVRRHANRYPMAKASVLEEFENYLPWAEERDRE